MIVIVDYGCGNLLSVYNMIRKAGGDVLISSDLNAIDKADKIILPGVGAFDTGMGTLSKGGFAEVLYRKAMVEKVPVLGLCLGLQLMTKGSREGNLPGLGFFDAQTIGFRSSLGAEARIPMIGWKNIYPRKESVLFNDLYENPKFYFLHSYYVQANRPEDILATTGLSFEYVAALEKDNLFGMQFHPEKSHKFGMVVFKNFLQL